MTKNTFVLQTWAPTAYKSKACKEYGHYKFVIKLWIGALRSVPTVSFYGSKSLGDFSIMLGPFILATEVYFIEYSSRKSNHKRLMSFFIVMNYFPWSFLWFFFFFFLSITIYLCASKWHFLSLRYYIFGNILTFNIFQKICLVKKYTAISFKK